jgi:hypothetical protein
MMVVSVVKIVFHLMSHDGPVGIATTLRTAIRRTVVRFPAETRSLLLSEEPRQLVGLTQLSVQSEALSSWVKRAGKGSWVLIFDLCLG